MLISRLRWLLSALFLPMMSTRGAEDNAWPLTVTWTNAATRELTREIFGPMIFSRVTDPGKVQGVRPFYLETHAGDDEQGSLLYPFFSWQRQPDFRSFSFFRLLNTSTDRGDPAGTDQHFDVWPFYFSRTAPDAADDYRALFPLAGTIKQRFGQDRISFTLFPFYLRTEKSGKETIHAPWPILRTIQGDGHHGFALWPLYGRSSRAQDYDRQFCLWPLLYRSATQLDESTPVINLGFLPFYSRDTGPGYVRENYLWPFFGYTHRTAPYTYDEQRYLWPFLVQGSGDDRRVNRWAPLYTHSNIKGTDKTWLLWPLYRQQKWQADGLAQEKSQVLFFLYWSLQQHGLAHPAAASAHKTHLWPLFSSWDDGNGQRQFQALSPFEVFFPGNETIRQLWSPLFAVYRYDRRVDGTSRHAVLWNALTYTTTQQEREFHLGPLFSYHSGPSHQRLAIGNGLIGIRRRPGALWHPFLFDFKTKPASVAGQSPSQ